MAEQRTLKLPIDLLALDLIGTVLIGVGLADGLGKAALVPESLQFSHYTATLVALGVALVLPLGIWLMRRILKPQN